MPNIDPFKLSVIIFLIIITLTSSYACYYSYDVSQNGIYCTNLDQLDRKLTDASSDIKKVQEELINLGDKLSAQNNSTETLQEIQDLASKVSDNDVQISYLESQVAYLHALR